MRKLLLAFACVAALGGITAPQRKSTFAAGAPVVDIAGLTPDIVRLIAQSLSERLGQQVIVDNRPGAGSNIGAEAVVRAPADGHTLLVLTFSNAINAIPYDRRNFDIEHDIAPVVGTFRSPTAMVVNPSFPAKTFPEFIAYAKANPGKINYASAGYGTVNNVAGEMFNAMAGISLVHVPYRGSYMPDLLGGQVQLTFAPIATAIEYIKAGKLRVLAVTGGARLDVLPGVPTMGEFLPGYETSSWLAIGAPSRTPTEIIVTLNKEINAALADPRVKDRLADLGATVLAGSLSDAAALISGETEKWRKAVRFSGAKAN